MLIKTNLYPISFDFRRNFTLLRSHITVPEELANRVRYRLSGELRRPVFRRNEYFYVLGEVIEKPTIKLEGGIVYTFESEGTTRINSFSSAREAQELFRDSLRLKNWNEVWLRHFFNHYGDRVIINWKHGKAHLIPEILTKIHEIDGNLYLQIDIKFRMLSRETLQALLEKEESLNIEEIEVKPIRSNATFRIEKIQSSRELSEEFIKEMTKITTNPYVKKAWEEILSGNRDIFIVHTDKGYTYPANTLRIVINFEQFEERQLSKLLSFVRLEPSERLNRIRFAAGLIKRLTKEFGWDIRISELSTGKKLNYINTLVDGAGRSERIYSNMKKFIEDLRPFITNSELKVSFIIVEKERIGKLINKRREFLNKLHEFLKKKGIKLNREKVIRILGKKRSTVKKELSNILDRIGNPNLVVVFLEEYEKVDPYEDFLLYDYIKSMLLSRNIPSQIILNNTLLKTNIRYVVLNVGEQILGKTGNIPYKLGKKLQNVDVFIGLDISRMKRRASTVNTAAFTKIFLSDGSFIRYRLSSFPSFGEEVSRKVIEDLFLKLKELGIDEGSKIVIHRDGRFPRGEVESFIEFSKVYKYNVELVEIIKSGNPRFFPESDVKKKLKGYYLKLDNNTIVLATYNNIFPGTHKPIKVRKVYGKLSVEEHASYILSLTLLNYASFQPIKLPATTHYSDKITGLLLRGIEPESKEGNIMYWL